MSICTCTPRQKATGKPSRRCEAHAGFQERPPRRKLPVFAYAYRSGQIEFGSHVPEGSLPIGQIGRSLTRTRIEGMARHAYDNKTLLVPGVPEAESDTAACDALLAWIARVTAGRKPPKRSPRSAA